MDLSLYYHTACINITKGKSLFFYRAKQRRVAKMDHYPLSYAVYTHTHTYIHRIEVAGHSVRLFKVIKSLLNKKFRSDFNRVNRSTISRISFFLEYIINFIFLFSRFSNMPIEFYINILLFM